jgi:hypothetical protein
VFSGQRLFAPLSLHGDEGIQSREYHKLIYQSMTQRPHCEITSGSLPRHPAVAYLFLVRYRTAGSV